MYKHSYYSKADKDFAKILDFTDIKFPMKITDIHKTEKRISSTLAFLVMKVKKNMQSMYQNNIIVSISYSPYHW